MIHARTFILVLIAACAVGAMNAAAAAAEEVMFSASKTGELKGSQLNTQVIKTKGGAIECAKDEVVPSESKVTSTLATTQKVTVKYSSCTAFGLVSATVSNAKYDFSASGIVTLENTVTVKAVNCTATIPAQENLGYVGYTNKSGKVEVELHIEGLESSGEGSFCSYEKEAEGTSSGKTLVELTGGTFEWQGGPQFKAEKNKYDLKFTVAPKTGTKQQFILEGTEQEQISCGSSKFSTITIPVAVGALTITPRLFNSPPTKCTAVIKGVQDSNITETLNTCKQLVLSAAATMAVGRCIFEVTDRTIGGTICAIEIEASNARPTITFNAVGTPKEVEVVEGVTGLKYKANAPCGTTNAMGNAEYKGVLMLKGEGGEGIEVK